MCVKCLFLYRYKKSGFLGHEEEDELQKTATKIKDETGIARNTVIKYKDKTH